MNDVSLIQARFHRFSLAGNRSFSICDERFLAATSPAVLLTISKVSTMISKLVPATVVAEDQILLLLQSAWRVSDTVYSEQMAITFRMTFRIEMC